MGKQGFLIVFFTVIKETVITIKGIYDLFCAVRPKSK